MLLASCKLTPAHEASDTTERVGTCNCFLRETAFRQVSENMNASATPPDTADACGLRLHRSICGNGCCYSAFLGFVPWGKSKFHETLFDMSVGHPAARGPQ